ncbi:DUF6538 domain-containing protein [Ruegeria marisrubri]|uniref:DUF6538 domain-containing protein n=1 Tax=Ruegeria marisrubri TaxID=1685379 RepID=UPI00296AA775|nr:DUF6538 domain-containing protein [Ruegeria marisrubri]
MKDGVFYFSRRILKELRNHYTSPRIAYSLRTKSPKIAEASARRAADQLDEYWYHLRCRDAELPGKHMLRLQRTTESRHPDIFGRAGTVHHPQDNGAGGRQPSRSPAWLASAGKRGSRAFEEGPQQRRCTMSQKGIL